MMDIDSSTLSSQTYTILRIKRKRTEEPLDALVVDSNVRAQRRKTRGGFDVFQYAATLEQAALEDEKQQKHLQHRISALAQTHSPNGTGENIIPQTPPSTLSNPVPVAPPQPSETPGRRYTVIKHPPASPPSRRPQPTAPPKVISHKELAHPKPDFTYYDAVPATEKEVNLSDDSAMDKFLPLLEEYLRINDVLTSSSGTSERSAEGDYVWDIFYHRPAKVNEWHKIAANIGTLTGLPASFGRADDSDTESDDEDDEDEDSNAEDNYKNDYPDEDEWDTSDDSNDLDEHSDHSSLFVDNGDSDEEWMHSAMRAGYTLSTNEA